MNLEESLSLYCLRKALGLAIPSAQAIVLLPRKRAEMSAMMMMMMMMMVMMMMMMVMMTRWLEQQLAKAMEPPWVLHWAKPRELE